MKKILNAGLLLLCCFASTVYATEKNPSDCTLACNDEREPSDPYQKASNVSDDENRPEGESRLNA